MNDYYVYEYWRLDKNVCFYVGKGKGYRAHDIYSHRNKHCQNIINLIEEVEIRFIYLGLTEEEAFQKEINRIAYLRSLGVELTNLHLGGTGTGVVLTEEIRKKMSLSHKGKPSNNKGKTFSVEARNNMSLAHKGKIPVNKGKPMSMEQRIKLSQSIKKVIREKGPFGILKRWAGRELGKSKEK